MKKSNNRVSQHKAKRYAKNKQRLRDKQHLSKFEKQQMRLREEIIMPALQLIQGSKQ